MSRFARGAGAALLALAAASPLPAAADTTDETSLAAQRDACTTGIGECGLRAALAVAEIAAAAGAANATITISGAPTIALAGPLTFSPDRALEGGGGEQPGGGGDTPPVETPPTETPPGEPTAEPAAEPVGSR